VAQHVRRKPLAFQGRAGAFGDRGVFGEQALDGVAAERAAVAGGEQRLGRLTVLLAQPGA